MSAGWIVGGVVGFCLTDSLLVLGSVVGIVMVGIASAVAGVTVLFCQQMSEVIYVASFALLSVGVTICYIATCQLALYWLPERPGLAGGISPLATGFGSLVISQIILALRSLFSDYHIHEGTIFFCLGILFVIDTSPWIPVMSLPPDKKEAEAERELRTGRTSRHSTWTNAWTLMKSSRSVGFSVMCLCSFIPSVAIVTYQEPLIVGLWNTPHPPVTTLSAILMTSYITGRVLCLLLSDKIGLKRVWLLSLLLQALLLLGLALLVTLSSQETWCWYASMVILSAYMLINPVFKMAGCGLCYHLFGYEQGLSAVSISSILFGLGGIAGPLFIHETRSRFGSYKQFLYGSAVLSFIGFIALLLIKPAARIEGRPPSQVDTLPCNGGIPDKD